MVLDDIKRVTFGDFYMGCGCRQRRLGRSEHCNDFTAQYTAVMLHSASLPKSLPQIMDYAVAFWRLSGPRLVCHCRLSQACHGDIIIREFSFMYAGAFNREDLDGIVPSSSILNYMSRLREEPEREEESSADEGVPQKGSGWRGNGAHVGRGGLRITGVLRRSNGGLSRALAGAETLSR